MSDFTKAIEMMEHIDSIDWKGRVVPEPNYNLAPLSDNPAIDIEEYRAKMDKLMDKLIDIL